MNNDLVQHENEFKKCNPQANEEVIQKLRLRTMSRLIIDHLIRKTQKQTELNIARLGSDENLYLKAREHSSIVVALPKELQNQVKRLVNQVLFNRVYREPRVMLMMNKAKRIIGTLFQSFMDEPEALPKLTQARLVDYFALTKKERGSISAKKKLARVVGDYIAGMTDKYAMDMYQLLTQAYEKAL
jgi:dGTPase